MTRGLRHTSKHLQCILCIKTVATFLSGSFWKERGVYALSWSWGTFQIHVYILQDRQCPKCVVLIVRDKTNSVSLLTQQCSTLLQIQHRTMWHVQCFWMSSSPALIFRNSCNTSSRKKDLCVECLLLAIRLACFDELILRYLHFY